VVAVVAAVVAGTRRLRRLPTSLLREL
jgi:Sec-independent protein translocase protein TatA